MARTSLRVHLSFAAAVVASVAAAVATTQPASASVEPGTPAKDVHIGADNDNASNPFIQPPGIKAPQHMDNTDVLFGRSNDDLLIGRLGSDVLLGGPQSDILVGGPSRPSTGSKAGRPGNDVMVGDDGNDIGIWSVGDGNDVFAGNEGDDTMIVGQLRTSAAGSPVLTQHNNRTIPRVNLDVPGGVSYQLLPVPPSEKLGVQYLLRVSVAGTGPSTIRLKEVEHIVLPAGRYAAPGLARVIDLTGPQPTVTTVHVSAVGGLTGAIVAPGS